LEELAAYIVRVVQEELVAQKTYQLVAFYRKRMG
jgi:hypothetical protein